ncbi:hypothetical protein QBC38DRAFT_468512 [Podospora fimiseda]|uniref:PNPLA domain-containing protein n=1 Tax=Podospora fimiseda TaxID=252190 RepID=A0AAN7H4C9_9PEZI|nr:hypothetical protein QBC38DRAFT_468512 [Podospora fimiseda]
MSPRGDEAINLLSFDGGGVRGYSSLLILHEIMKQMQKELGLAVLPKPCDYFHMIAGTSTGGLIAIMLGRLRMSTEEALREYEECAEKIFSKENKKRWNLSDKFRATALQEVIEGIVKDRQVGESMYDPTGPAKGKVLVCVMPSSQIGEPKLVRSFSRFDDWDHNIKIWEAARATTAASTYFKPQQLGTGEHYDSYIDAALGVNNPVEKLADEAIKEFGSDRKMGCVLSIGTGTRKIKLGRAATGFKNFIQIWGYFLGLGQTLKNLTTDGEESHRRLRAKLHVFPNAYFRFNVPNAAEEVKLSDYTKMAELKNMTLTYLSLEDVIDKVAQVASAVGHDAFDHGLTLGTGCGLEKSQVVLSNKKARSMPKSNGFFTGREEILERLNTFFSPRDTGGKPRREFLLYGLGGVGKTEIALKAAEMMGDRFEHQHVFYIDGSTPVTITQSYATIAENNNLGSGNPETLKNIALQWIGSLTEEWLVIFDDLVGDSPGRLPGRGKGNIIYTSRTSEYSTNLPADCVIEVTEMDNQDAVQLLLKAASWHPKSRNQEDVASAQAIVAQLGRLPLAIIQAAATIRKDIRGETYTLRKYLEDLQKKQVCLFENPRFNERKPENSIVYTTLELSHDAIKTIKIRKGRTFEGRQAAAALDLLNLLCFYHHERFPWRTFGRAVKERRKMNTDRVYPFNQITNDPERNLDALIWIQKDGECNLGWFVAGLQLLRQFSLVRVDDNQYISMHILVRNWAQHRMDKEVFRQQRLMAMILLTESIVPSLRVLDKLHMQGLLSHVDSCFTEEPEPINNDAYEAYLCSKFGWFYASQKNFSSAERFLLTSKRLFRIEFGTEGWPTINATTFLAMLYHDGWLLGEAEQAWLEAIDAVKLRKQAIEDRLEELEEMEQLEKQRLAENSTPVKRLIHKVDQGLKKPFSSAILDHLVTKGTAKASISAETNVQDLLEDLGELDAMTDIFHLQLSRVHMDQGRFGAGKRVFLKALEELKEVLPEDEPEMMNYLIESEYIKGNNDVEFWIKRLDQITDAASKNEEIWNYADTYQVLEFLAKVRLYHDQWETAFSEFSQVLRHYELIHGRRDRRCLSVLRNMAICQTYCGKTESAVKISRIALERSKRGYGRWHIETVKCLESLATSIYFRDSEASDETIALFEEAELVAEEVLGLLHKETTRVKRLLKKHREDNTLTIKVAAERFKGMSVEELHEKIEEEIRDMKATIGGKDCALLERYSALIAGGPPKTQEEVLVRFQASFGPNNRATKEVAQRIEERKKAESEDDEGYYGEAYAFGTDDSENQSSGGDGKPRDKGKGIDLSLPFTIPTEGMSTKQVVDVDDLVASDFAVEEIDFDEQFLAYSTYSTEPSSSKQPPYEFLRVQKMRWKGGYMACHT